MKHDNTEQLHAVIKKAAATIQDLKKKLEAHEKAQSGRVAVIGAACRFPPDLDTLDKYWEFLEKGLTCFRDVDRWDEDLFSAGASEPGRIGSRKAALLSSYKSFDPEFFSISPKEARAMDPQQRLLLEVAWEAMANAGLNPDRVKGRKIGVFIGAMNSDYATLQQTRCSYSEVTSHVATGQTASVLAGRLSYFFELNGPSVTIDTACSSSLVALHLARKSVMDGECELAIVGGVSLLLAPENMLVRSQGKMLSPTDECRVFDERANGFVIGEGCGVLIIKKADETQDDNVVCFVEGSAVNHNGKSSGLTVPNGAAQKELIKECLRQAHVKLEDLAYIEAHGTGTSIGDPIEMLALTELLEGPNSVLPPVGSVKANIGHLESAAGIAGLIKAMLCLKNGKVPPQAQFDSLNKLFEEPSKITIPKAPHAIQADAKGQAFIGISSFGLSGTNAHVIISSPGQAAPIATPAAAAPLPFPVSAHSAESLASYLRTLRSYIAGESDLNLVQLSSTLCFRRKVLPYRKLFFAANKDSLVAAIDAALHAGSFKKAGASQPLFVFSGQGSQWPGMGLALLEYPDFRAKLEECEAIVRETAGWSIQTLLREMDGHTLEQTRFAQPLIFSIQVSLVHLLLKLGVKPKAVLGHSLGEVAAAHASGALDLKDALCLIIKRGELMESAHGRGAMIQIGVGADAARSFLIPGISIAARNSPDTTVLSGTLDAIQEVKKKLQEAKIPVQDLRVSYPFHSEVLDPILQELGSLAQSLNFMKPRISWYSTVTGSKLRAEFGHAAYWSDNARQTVEFSEAFLGAMKAGLNIACEIGPHAVLIDPMRQMINPSMQVCVTVQNRRSPQSSFYACLAAFHEAGLSLAWESLGASWMRPLPLPNYEWTREDYWLNENSLKKPMIEALAIYQDSWVAAPNSGTRRQSMIYAAQSQEELTLILGKLTEGPSHHGKSQLVVDIGPADCLQHALACYQSFIRSGKEGRLWFVSDDPTNPSLEDHLDSSALLGMILVLAIENPERIGGLIFKPRDQSLESLSHTLESLIQTSGGDRVYRLSKEGVQIRRLASVKVKTKALPSYAGCHLITGGLGYIGLKLAEHLVNAGAQKLILVGRTPVHELPPDKLQLVRRLEARTCVVLESADASNMGQMKNVLERHCSPEIPLQGIFHAAGVAYEQAAADVELETIDRSIAAKVAGAWNLHQLSLGYKLQHFVMFSSISSLWGARGQVLYASGNAFLDALSHYRKSLDLPGLSLNWGPWEGEGLTRNTNVESLEKVGLRLMSCARAFHTMDLLSGEQGNFAVVDVDWARFTAIMEERYVGSLFHAQKNVVNLPSEPGPVKSVRPFGELKDQPLQDAIVGRLKDIVGLVLGHHKAATVPVDIGFFDLGMDSILLSELKIAVEHAFCMDLRSSTLFNRPNIAKLADFIRKECYGDPPESAPAQEKDGQVASVEFDLDALSVEEIDYLLSN